MKNEFNYEPKKRWLRFADISDPKQKTKRFVVCNTSNMDRLGYIKWHPSWRQYVYDDGTIIFGEGCLFEIFEQIVKLRKEREENRKV